MFDLYHGKFYITRCVRGSGGCNEKFVVLFDLYNGKSCITQCVRGSGGFNEKSTVSFDLFTVRFILLIVLGAQGVVIKSLQYYSTCTTVSFVSLIMC